MSVIAKRILSERLIALAAKPTMDEPAYWQAKVARERECTGSMPQPCFDCAVVSDFYRDHADALATMPEPLRTQALARWSCHNSPDCVCAGARGVVR